VVIRPARPSDRKQRQDKREETSQDPGIGSRAPHGSGRGALDRVALRWPEHARPRGGGGRRRRRRSRPQVDIRFGRRRGKPLGLGVPGKASAVSPDGRGGRPGRRRGAAGSLRSSESREHRPLATASRPVVLSRRRLREGPCGPIASSSQPGKGAGFFVELGFPPPLRREAGRVDLGGAARSGRAHILHQHRVFDS